MSIVSFLVTFVTDESVRLVTRAEQKPPNMRTEQERIALLGRPRLGDVIRAQIRIKESKEFKVNTRLIHLKCHSFIFRTKFVVKNYFSLKIFVRFREIYK